MSRNILCLIIYIFAQLSYGQTDQRSIIQSSRVNQPSWQILVDGKAIDNAIDLASLSVSLHLNEPPAAKIEIIVDQNQLQYGYSFLSPQNQKVEIMLGYEGINEPVFIGRLVSQNIIHSQKDPFIMILECEGAVKSYKIYDNISYNFSFGSNLLNIDLRLVHSGDIEGFVTVPGNPGLEPGRLIELNGLSTGYDETYYIKGVRHELDESGWKTDCHLKKHL